MEVLDYEINLKELKLTKIYALSSSRYPNQYRYIGKTDGTLRNRLKQHLSEAFRCKPNNKTYKVNWLKSELEKNNSIIITLLDEVTRDQWQESEKYYIHYYKSIGARLTNGNEGGGGLPEGKTKVKKETEIKKRIIIKRRIKRGRKKRPKEPYQRKTPNKADLFWIDEKTGRKILITPGFLARQKAKLEKMVDSEILI